MLVATAAAQLPYGHYAAPYWVGPTSQYHHQDAFGRASYGFSHPGQAANHHRDGLGNQVGSYAYINPEGKHVQVAYTADALGFRVLSNDLPVAPVENVRDAPDVAAAKAIHFAKWNEAAAAAAQSRKKRQVLAAVPYTALEHPQYAADFFSSSTDLNRDGMPDNYQTGVLPYSYSALPYHFGYSGYPFVY